MAFNLERFEFLSYQHQHEEACRELLNLLHELDANYGIWGNGLELSPPSSITQQDLNEHLLTRITSAITSLLSDKNLQFSPDWFSRILSTQRWLSTLFSASAFRNSDHIIRALGPKLENDAQHISISGNDLIKLCMLYSAESELTLDVDALFAADQRLAVSLCIALISPRFLGSPQAHTKRELILPWLTEKLHAIDNLDDLPSGVLHDVYMHCSYADRADKHDVKKSINQLIRKKLAELKIYDSIVPVKIEASKKQVLLVVVEWFTSAHSIYRTHSLTIEACKDIFHVVGVGYPNCVDDVTMSVFDQFIPIPDGDIYSQLKNIKEIAFKQKAQILYMPSVGMFPLTMYLTNLRVAPIQIMALGHPATSHSDCVDYVVVEEDYVGDPKCFSEKLLVLPSDGMPYRPSVLAKDLNLERVYRENPDVVRIVLCSTTMKLNPSFLETCKKILEKSQVKIHFEFLIGQAQGLIYPQVDRLVHQYLGGAVTVHPHLDYASYMKVIASCDMFINPFPFGNTNGIIDTITCGLVGVCKTGAEVHEHIDQGLFERLEFPEWLVTTTNDEYVDAVIRLAQDHELRISLSRKLSGEGNLYKIFNGRPLIMSMKFQQLLTAN